MYLVSSSKHLYKGWSLLYGLLANHDSHTHHGHSIAEIVGDLDREATALSVHHIEAVGGQPVLQLLLVVHM